MLNLNRISPIADFCSEINSKLKVISGNVLYITHEMDKIKKIVTKLENSSRLQSQVDEFFDETSPQTEQTTNETIPEEA